MSIIKSNPDLAELSENIRTQRKAKGMTQSQLAEKASVSDSTVQRLEGIQGKVSVDTLFQLAKALGVTPNDLAPKHFGFTLVNATLSSVNERFILLSDKNKAVVITSLNAMVEGLLLQQR